MLPHYLREPLEQLGAKVTPLENGTTHVQVPGADREYFFSPYSVGEVRLEAYPLGKKVLPVEQGYLPHQHPGSQDLDEILYSMSEGHVSHSGPHHTLTLHQYYRPPHRTHDGNYGVVRHGRFSYDLSSDPQPDYKAEHVTTDTTEDATEAHLVNSIFNSRPNYFIHGLLDHLQEKHGHHLPLLHEHPHQYARQLSDRYEELQEQLL